MWARTDSCDTRAPAGFGKIARPSAHPDPRMTVTRTTSAFTRRVYGGLGFIRPRTTSRGCAGLPVIRPPGSARRKWSFAPTLPLPPRVLPAFERGADLRHRDSEEIGRAHV